MKKFTEKEHTKKHCQKENTYNENCEYCNKSIPCSHYEYRTWANGQMTCENCGKTLINK